MSRTYRKVPRCYAKFRGEFYNTHDDKTVKGKVRRYKSADEWLNEIHGGAAYSFQTVEVADRDNYGNFGRSSIKWYKRIAHKRDRARCKNALYHHPEDVHFKPGFDIWEID